MKLTVERIVEGVAVLEKEDLSHIEVEISLLPEGIREGNVLIYDGSAYSLDEEAEKKQRTRIINKQRSAFKKR